MKVKSFSCVRLFETPWTVDYQALPSVGFSRQAYWSGLLFPSPGDLPNPGIEPRSPTLQADALTSEPPGKHGISVKPPKDKVQRASRLTDKWRFRESGILGEGVEAPCPSLDRPMYVSLPSDCSQVVSFC